MARRSKMLFQARQRDSVSPALLFSHSFWQDRKNGPPEHNRAIPAQKRYGPRTGGGAAYRTVLSAHTKHAAGSIRAILTQKTSAEAEEIGREGQNLHNLQKSTLDNDRKIRMIILSHNRSIGRRGKTGRCDGWRKISCLRRSGPIWPRSLTFRRMRSPRDDL